MEGERLRWISSWEGRLSRCRFRVREEKRVGDWTRWGVWKSRDNMFEGGEERRELDREISESERFLLIVMFAIIDNCRVDVGLVARR